jgi:hypothetical protein
VDFEIEFAEEPPHVTVTTWGAVDADGMVRYREQLLADPRFSPGKTILGDHTRLDTSAFTSEDVRRLAQRIATLDDEIAASAVAMVVSSPANFGLSKMWQVFTDADPSRLHAFYSRDEAIAWLRG